MSSYTISVPYAIVMSEKCKNAPLGLGFHTLTQVPLSLKGVKVCAKLADLDFFAKNKAERKVVCVRV